MNQRRKRVKIGIVGCGAIGSRIAKSIKDDFKNEALLTGLYDIDFTKADALAYAINLRNIVKASLNELIKNCDFMVEAVNARQTKDIIREALRLKKNVLAMSVGKLLGAAELFKLAQKNHCMVLLPSGAISGLDAVKAAGLAGISSVTLTTRKPPLGFSQSSYIAKKNIDLENIRSETIIFEGNVMRAVKLFPQNINVAATLALACGAPKKMRIRIIASPHSKTNSHEIEVIGDFGRMVSRTENVVCPDNPKTSYLAVLSAIQTLKQFFNVVKIGT